MSEDRRPHQALEFSEKTSPGSDDLLYLIENAPIGIFQSSLEGKVLRMNPAGAAIAGFSNAAEMIQSVNDVARDLYLDPEDRRELIDEVLGKPGWSRFQKAFYFKGKGLTWCNLTMRAVRDEDGTVLHLEGFIEDITGQKNAEESLERAHQNLEIQLAKRTGELQHRSEHLERVTIALRVLLDERVEERRAFEEAILLNIKTLVKPLLKRLRKTSSFEELLHCLKVLETRIEEITSSFLTTLSRKFLDLTPTEIQIANLVKEGRGSKEIGQLLYLSENTVRFHRQNLRRKLGLRGNKAGLQSYLLSLRD
jgi:PAS domain S-box-containing protein